MISRPDWTYQPPPSPNAPATVPATTVDNGRIARGDWTKPPETANAAVPPATRGGVVHRPDWSATPPSERKADDAAHGAAPISGEDLALVAPDADASDDGEADEDLEEAEEAEDAADVDDPDGNSEELEVADGDAPALDPALLEEWAKTGSVEHNRGVAHRAAQAILAELDDEGGEQFQNAFDQLPQGVQTGVYRFLAIDGAGSSRPASEAAVREFSELGDETAELAASWGSQAARRLGVAKGRVNLMLGSMSSSDRDAAVNWLDALEPAQQAAVMKVLSRGR